MNLMYVALLRGINVGGHNMLPMKELRDIALQLGCEKVQTYIQSGNLIFTADEARASELSNRLTARIADQFNLNVPVVLRSRADLQSILTSNPYVAAGMPAESLHAMFLAATPEPERVSLLDANRFLPQTYRLEGREIYLYLPHGVATSKLTNTYFDRTLSTTSTLRNWRTVRMLYELMN